MNEAKRIKEQEAEDAIARERDLFLEDTLVIEGTDEAQRRFREKLQEMRRTGSIPGYIGPRAGRDS